LKIKKRIAVVTGCYGFIGSHLTEFLIKKKYFVVGLDNLSTGRKFFLNKMNTKNFKFYRVNLLTDNLDKYFKNVQTVFHLAANADVRYGLKHRDKDIKQNIIVTHRILEQLYKNNIKKFIFSSTGSVYGDSKDIPTKETTSFPIQTSLYGASKISAESLITSYSEAYNIKCFIFRFVGILGPRYTHGHIYDFLLQLLNNPKILKVLGDGNQKKSYMHVEDCINAIWKSINFFKDRVNIINLGNPEYITVKESIKIISKCLNLRPLIKYQGGKRGWVGDSPFIFLNTNKIGKTGWKPKFTIEESVQSTVKYIMSNKWILKN